MLATVAPTATSAIRFSAINQGEIITTEEKETLYLMALSSNSGLTSISFRGDLGGLSTYVYLVCAYL